MTRQQRLWLLLPLIWLFFFMALDSMVDDSPTMDEQNHLARGAAFVHTGDPRLSLEHPPLTNALSGLPVALLLPDLRFPTDHSSWERQPPDVYWYVFADLFLWEYNQDVTRMLFLGRLPIVFLTLGMALVGFHFARELWGSTAALAVFCLLLFDPNLLAHGRYVTTDLGGAAFVLLATWLLWRWWRAPAWSWSRWLLAGLGMGLAFSSKLSTLAFVPVWAVTALLPIPGILSVRWLPAVGKRLWRLAAAGLLSIGFVWLSFALEWGAFRFHSDSLAVLNRWRGPMPTFWAGIEQILLLTGSGRYEAFLLGEFSADGFPLYFPAAFLMKTPLAVLALLLLALLILLTNARWRRRALLPLAPALLYFLLATQSSLNIGYRHLLPMLPLLYVFGSGLAAAVAEPGALPRLRVPYSALRIPFYGLLLAQIGTALLIHPHYLAFFNRAAGGPEHGYRLLLDSNVDWGQDLLRLRTWMAEQDVDRVKLGWFGTADPGYYELRYDPLPGFPRYEFMSLWGSPPFEPVQPAPGLYAISAGSLWELPLPQEQKQVYAWFRARKPDAHVGYSILIYDLR